MLIEKRAPEELLAVRKENAAKLPAGTAVKHKTFGRGVVESIEVEKGRIGIVFDDVGFKKLTLTEIFTYITIERIE